MVGRTWSLRPLSTPMSADKRWRLIAYDISDRKTYRSVYKVLRGHGRTVQYSLFRCFLDDRETELLRTELAELMDPTDKLLVVDLCSTCAHQVVSRNHTTGWTAKPARFTVVGRSRTLASNVGLGTEALASSRKETKIDCVTSLEVPDGKKG